MTVTPSQTSRHRYLLPEERGRRSGTLSLLMVAVTVAMFVAAWAAGTFLQIVVFDLDEQESLANAGAWGYVAGAGLIGLMIAPALAGIVFGARARHSAARRLGTTGIVVNVLIVTYLVIASAAGLMFG